ncbi:MAG: LacI family DNA-binding transcriptional regulator [Leucobacter sp.]
MSPKEAANSRPTMQDVADRVGLSRQLVSIVLSGAEGASEASRERVHAAARELGYYPDDSARLLRRRRSGQIGVFFTMRQPFEVDLVDALYRQAEAHGFHLVLSTIGPGRSQRVALDELMRQRLEALIVLAAVGGAGTIDELPRGIPVVLLGGPIASGRFDDVRAENESGIAQAVDHLHDLGHRRICYVGPSASPNAAARLTGYRESMRRHGLDAHVDIVESTYTEEGGHAAALELLTRPQLPTALVCANDRCAFGVMMTLIRAGKRVPEDISIVGFDDSSIARFPFVDMTSVHPDVEQMAARAIEAVRNRLDDPGGAAPYGADPAGAGAEGADPADADPADADSAGADSAGEVWDHPIPVTLSVRGSTGPPPAPKP